MFINFDKIELAVLPEFKGGVGVNKLRSVFDGKNKIMLGTLEPSSSIGYHSHESNSEIIYIISGDAKCLYDGETEYLKPGQYHYCPMGHSHSLINNSDRDELVYFSVIPEHKI